MNPGTRELRTPDSTQPAATAPGAPAAAAEDDLPRPVMLPELAAGGPAVVDFEAQEHSLMAESPPEPPAQWGWRGRLNRAAGGKLHVAASVEEKRYRAARRHLLYPFARTMTVVVANPKGGAAKTPSTLLAAATLGYHRGGYTLAWDNNETRGTLGLRAEASHHNRNVIDLLQVIDRFLGAPASVGELAAFLRPQSAHFDVLASDELPGRMEMIDDAAFDRLCTALSRFYRVMVIDTGNNVRSANWRAATSLADCLVIPTTVQRDVADSGLWMLDHLIRIGRADLAANAVAIVSCADPHTDPALLEEISARYRQVVRTVEMIPFDPLVRSGGRISFEQLSVATRRAWLMASKAIVDALIEREALTERG